MAFSCVAKINLKRNYILPLMTSKINTTTIAIDAMGGDHGPNVTVPAAVKFLNSAASGAHHIILVGNSALISSLIQEHNADSLLRAGSLSIQQASEVVEMDESPALALKRKKDSSMRVAINLVKQGTAQAAVSAGNTGALMATAKFVLKTIAGVDRPAIISTMPCRDMSQTVHMLDLGANVDSSPEMLVQFAVMGSVLTEYVDGKPSPRVGLLNVGAEEIKGSEKVKKASALIGDSTLNYVGYVEGDELFSGAVDTAKMILSVLSEEFKRNIFTKALGALCMPIFKAMQARLDPRLHNGASLIGLNGIVVKSHGGTDELGFLHAIQEANRQAELDVIGHISKEISTVFSSLKQ